MPPKQSSIQSLLRSEEVTLSVGRRIKARPAGVSAVLETGEVITVVSTNPDTLALSFGDLIDLGKQIIDGIGDILDGDGDGGGDGDTVTVTVKGAGGRKVTVTIN